MQIQSSSEGQATGGNWATRPQAFVLIDLFSQGRAVQHYVRTWPKIEVLTWLQYWGTLDSRQGAGFPETYTFRSRFGEVAYFILQDGVFTFLGDNSVAFSPESNEW